MSNIDKDRDISMVEFLTNLQKEWLVNDFRRKIYPSPSDKRYHQRVMEYKREKIEDISNRTGLPNIFTSDEAKKEMYSKLFNKLNQPIFALSEKDTQFYYDSGSDFVIHGIGIVAVLKDVDFTKGWAHLFSEENYTAELSDISRVL